MRESAGAEYIEAWTSWPHEVLLPVVEDRILTAINRDSMNLWGTYPQGGGGGVGRG